jgi:hypothetical protein
MAQRDATSPLYWLGAMIVRWDGVDVCFSCDGVGLIGGSELLWRWRGGNAIGAYCQSLVVPR